MAEIGLFPLGIVLLPTEQVPLHIFEDRYKELIDECLAEEREFGLVYADDDGLRPVGTLAAVTEVIERQREIAERAATNGKVEPREERPGAA